MIYAVGAFGPASADAVAALVALFGDHDSRMRMGVAKALGAIGPPAADAVPAIMLFAFGGMASEVSHMRFLREAGHCHGEHQRTTRR